MRLLRRIPALLLAVTLALAIGLMPVSTLLLAAPAAQPSGTTVFGYFESEVIPGGGNSPDLVVGLLLYEDGSAELVSDYQTDENVIVEVGTWVDNGDGTLTLTVTGTTDGAYAAPVALDFAITDDGSLFSDAFGAEGLSLLPATLPAGGTPGAAPAASNSEIILAQIPSNALVYQSDLLPAASTPGLQLTLAIFDDSSLTLISDYVNPGEIVVEVGTWSEDVDGSLVVNLIGQIENGTGTLNEYEDTLEFVFTPNADGSLSLVDEGGALFGDEGLTLFPAEATGEAIETSGTATAGETVAAEEATEEEATEESTPEATATPEATVESSTITETETITPEVTVTPSTTITSTDVVTTSEALTETEGVTTTGLFTPSGAYISEVLPSAGSNGTFLVTILYDDGTLLFTTYSLDGDLPVVEIGTWVDNLDGTYTITATGTVEEEYAEPIEVNFTINERGAVVISGVALYPLADIDLAGAPTLVATFQSELITDTIDISHTLTLDLYDDFSAELITEYAESEEVVVQYGEWALDEADDSLTLTLIGDEIADYDEPIEWVFEANVDDTLVLLSDEEEYYGEDGLTLYGVVGAEEVDALPASETPAQETSAEEATDEVVNAIALEGAQFFQSEVLPAASSPGLQLTLGLLDDGSAALDYDYMNGEAVITNVGEWVDNADGSISITLTEGPNGTLTLPVELTLELDDDGNLVIVDVTEESLGLLDVTLAPVLLE